MGIFKAYDIRGVYPNELDEAQAERIGFAFAKTLGGKRYVVGRDMRVSSPSLAAAAIRGILKAGANVVDIGLTSTPMNYFAVGHMGVDGGLAVTASHNPGQYNGFKASRDQAKPMSYDTGLREIEQLALEGTHDPAPEPGQAMEVSVLDDYVEHVLAFAANLRPLRIAVDAGNGAAGVVVPKLFERLSNTELVPLFMEPDGTFPNHAANPLVDENVADLRAKVVEEGCDLGVAYDGDADRVAFVDETGRRVPSDLVTALLAREALERHRGKAVVYDLRSSWVVAEEIRAAGGIPVRERVGHSFIKAALREHDAILGGEVSGHYYFAENFFADSGDIALLKVLNLMCREGRKLSALVKPLRRYRSTGEVNFVVEDKDELLERLVRLFRDGQVDRADGVTVQYDDWWFNVRKSNTEPLVRLNLEAKTLQRLQAGKARLLEILGTPVSSGGGGGH
jgi:phosphomannomutase